MKCECSELRLEVHWEEGRALEDGGMESEGAQQEDKGRWVYRGSACKEGSRKDQSTCWGGMFCTHVSVNGRDLSMHGGELSTEWTSKNYHSHEGELRLSKEEGGSPQKK